MNGWFSVAAEELIARVTSTEIRLAQALKLLAFLSHRAHILRATGNGKPATW